MVGVGCWGVGVGVAEVVSERCRTTTAVRELERSRMRVRQLN